MDGIINVFKEEGMTSFRVVSLLKKILKTKKVGHTGTLDPMAIGVLPICVNKGTKVVEYLMKGDKEYIGILKLGLATDTQDIWGKTLKTSDKFVKKDEVLGVISTFVGEILQIPPMYSAIKIDGQKMCDLARMGVEVERKERKITIYEIEMLECDEEKMEYTLRVKCSKGTYIRTLFNDIGDKLGTFGTMAYLKRTKSGAFDESTAMTIEQIEKLVAEGLIEEKILPIDSPFMEYEKYVADEVQEKLIKNGLTLSLSRTTIEGDNGMVRVYNEAGDFLILGKKSKEEDALTLVKSFW